MELKRLTDLFWKLAPNLFFFSVVLGVVTGLCYAMIVPFIMHVLGNNIIDFGLLRAEGMSFFNSPTSDIALVFLGVCFTIVVLNSISGLLSAYIAMKATIEHRLMLYRRIQKLAFADLERIGQARLINLLNVDVPAITGAALTFPQIWLNTVTVGGILGYLMYLNFDVFVIVVACVGIAALSYIIPVEIGGSFFAESRNIYDKVQEAVKGLVYGFKELKLNKDKSDRYYVEELEAAELESMNASLKGTAVFEIAENYGEILIYLIIGVCVFHLPYVYTISQGELIGIVVALLYLAGPIGDIFESIEAINHGNIALNKLKEFYGELTDENLEDKRQVPRDWTHFKASGVAYSYEQSKKKDGFALKPVDVEFKRGEISYIIGGNGSGKSTFSKCVSLHYHPTEGHMAFDDIAVDNECMIDARDRISAIYSDFYLFNKLFQDVSPEKKQVIDDYLTFLELKDKVTLENGEFSTVNLSDGQKKRLALLVLVLEDRDICIFDEWASDQDPRFKEVFYTKILPDLREQNKAVICISHDDRYFKYADKLVVMESGALKEVITDTEHHTLVSTIGEF